MARLRLKATVFTLARLLAITSSLLERAASPVAEVVVDLRRLEFMNSSCLKTLVTWLNNVRQRPPAQQYLIRFLRDRAAYWQERSLSALKAFAPAIVELE